MAQPSAQSPIQTAESFAGMWSTTDAPLDFSPDSLDALERLVMTFLNVGDGNAPDFAEELVGASCYIGEVVRRTLGGEWASAGGGADMLRGVAGRAGEAGIVIPLSDLMLVASEPAPSLAAWYRAIGQGFGE